MRVMAHIRYSLGEGTRGMATEPRKQPRQARSQALVEAILDAATRIMVRDGREAANTNAIAREAGVSIGSLYQYFPNREAVLASLLHRHGHRIHDQVAHKGAAPASLEEAVTGVAADVFAAHRIELTLHDALHHDFGHDHGHGALTTRAAVRARMERWPAAVQAEIACGTPTQAHLVVSEIIHSLAHAALVHPAEATDAALVEQQAVRAVLAYLRTA